MHLVDIENLCGGGHLLADEAHIARLWTSYRRVARFSIVDLVGVACSPSAILNVRAAIPYGALRARRGVDGADHALLDFADVRVRSERVDRVVIGSGDGIFADMALDSRKAGKRVVVVAPRGGLSRRLARAAHEVHTLPTGSGRMTVMR